MDDGTIGGTGVNALGIAGRGRVSVTGRILGPYHKGVAAISQCCIVLRSGAGAVSAGIHPALKSRAGLAGGKTETSRTAV